MWVLNLGLLAPLKNILKIFLSFGPTLAPWFTPGGHPRGGFLTWFFKVSNPCIRVLYLVLFESLVKILKILFSFGPTLAPKVTPGGHPRGGFGRDFLRYQTPTCGCSIWDCLRHWWIFWKYFWVWVWVTLKGHPRGSPQVVTPIVVRDVGAHIYDLKEAKAFQEFSQNITMKLKVLYSLMTLLIMKN